MFPTSLQFPGCLKGNISLENRKPSLHRHFALPSHSESDHFISSPRDFPFCNKHVSLLPVWLFLIPLHRSSQNITETNDCVTGNTERNAPATSGNRSRVFVGWDLGMRWNF